MDDQQTNQPADRAYQQDEPNGVLPPVQQPAAGDDVQAAASAPPSGPPPSGMDAQQTVPDSRALIEIPDEAGDNDLIEKEWVLKAKQIVEHTAEDPFQQQEELSKMKADYLKKRYNRDLGTV